MSEFSITAIRGAVTEVVEDGRRSTRARTRNVTFCMPDEHVIKLEAIAEGLNMNKSETIRLLIEVAWESGQE